MNWRDLGPKKQLFYPYQNPHHSWVTPLRIFLERKSVVIILVTEWQLFPVPKGFHCHGLFIRDPRCCLSCLESSSRGPKVRTTQHTWTRSETMRVKDLVISPLSSRRKRPNVFRVVLWTMFLSMVVFGRRGGGEILFPEFLVWNFLILFILSAKMCMCVCVSTMGPEYKTPCVKSRLYKYPGKTVCFLIFIVGHEYNSFWIFWNQVILKSVKGPSKDRHRLRRSIGPHYCRG